MHPATYANNLSPPLNPNFGLFPVLQKMASHALRVDSYLAPLGPDLTARLPVSSVCDPNLAGGFSIPANPARMPLPVVAFRCRLGDVVADG